MSRSKKLINAPEDCVDENLEGFAMINTGIRKVAGHRIMVREDYQEMIKAGKVSLVSGGGSGHEPQVSGFVGRGMLTSCVMGSIFASPPSQEILLALRLVGKNNPAGCLLIIANYTGDRLNFGVAMEKAKQEGIKVESMIIGEDCAMVSQNKKTGRRGLTGFVLTYKLAGALSEEGKSLEEIIRILNTITDNMGSIGLSLTACTTPGSGTTFTIADDEMELGLGVHGEAGVQTLKIMSAKETVETMIEHMTNSSNDNRINLSKGDKLACILNNLGGTTNLEMNILVKEVVSYLESAFSVNVERTYSGYFNTSQEMAGIIITLLKLDDTTTRLIDAPTEAPWWPHPLLSSISKLNRRAIEVHSTAEIELEDSKYAIFSTPGERCLMYDIMCNICKSLISAESRLNVLDTEGGDGDCGTTLAKGAQVLLTSLGQKDSPGSPIHSPYLLLSKLANVAENYMGGSSGALYSLFLTSGATCLKQSITPESWCNALEKGIATIKRYGGAEPGDRTMLDPLCAASITLQTGLKSDPILTVLMQVSDAVEKSAADTVYMTARAGRASYVSAERLKEADPGAVGVAVWIRAITDTLQEYFN